MHVYRIDIGPYRSADRWHYCNFNCINKIKYSVSYSLILISNLIFETWVNHLKIRVIFNASLGIANLMFTVILRFMKINKIYCLLSITITFIMHFNSYYVLCYEVLQIYLKFCYEVDHWLALLLIFV